MIGISIATTTCVHKGKKGNITTIAVILIFIFSSLFYFVANLPLVEGEARVLEDRDEGRILSGYYMYAQEYLRKGSVTFNFIVSRNVDGFIMTESQYSGFSEGTYLGSLEAVNSVQVGSLSCEITTRGKYYFVIINISDKDTMIQSLHIEYTPSKQTILESIC